MSETYETIGTAVRQHNAIRLNLKKGEPTTYFIAADAVARLFGRRTVPIYRLRLSDDYVIPERVEAGSASISSTGRSVLIRLGRDCLQIPTQQLTVHYMRDLGETSKIVRKIEGAPAPSAAAATAPALAVV